MAVLGSQGKPNSKMQSTPSVVGDITGVPLWRDGAFLAHLTALSHLDLSRTMLHDSEMRHLTGLTCLEMLDLSHTSLDNEAACHLTGLLLLLKTSYKLVTFQILLDEKIKLVKIFIINFEEERKKRIKIYDISSCLVVYNLLMRSSDKVGKPTRHYYPLVKLSRSTDKISLRRPVNLDALHLLRCRSLLSWQTPWILPVCRPVGEAEETGRGLYAHAQFGRSRTCLRPSPGLPGEP